ncbi:MAG: hypothetical protein KC486_31120 [Myxococcales bacterium]|nr:hypothetical protein [Myxococcales bacterium]
MSTSRERRLRAEALAWAENQRRELGDPADLSVRRGLFEIAWRGGEGPTVTRLPNELDEPIKAVILEVWGGPHAVTVQEASAEPAAYARIAVRPDLATFDGDRLTQLVVACHRHAVRGEIVEGGFGRAVVLLQRRDHEALDERARHPDVDALSQRLHAPEDDELRRDLIEHAVALNQIREALRPEHDPESWSPDEVARSVIEKLAAKRVQAAQIAEFRAEVERLREREATADGAALKTAHADILRMQERLDEVADKLAEIVGQRGSAEELAALLGSRHQPPASGVDGIQRLRGHVRELRALAQAAARGGWRGAQDANREITGATAGLERALAVLRLHEGRAAHG